MIRKCRLSCAIWCNSWSLDTRSCPRRHFIGSVNMIVILNKLNRYITYVHFVTFSRMCAVDVSRQHLRLMDSFIITAACLNPSRDLKLRDRRTVRLVTEHRLIKLFNRLKASRGFVLLRQIPASLYTDYRKAFTNRFTRLKQWTSEAIEDSWADLSSLVGSVIRERRSVNSKVNRPGIVWLALQRKTDINYTTSV